MSIDLSEIFVWLLLFPYAKDGFNFLNILCTGLHLQTLRQILSFRCRDDPLQCLWNINWYWRYTNAKMSEYIYILWCPTPFFSIFQHEWPVFHQPDEMYMKYKIFFLFFHDTRWSVIILRPASFIEQIYSAYS